MTQSIRNMNTKMQYGNTLSYTWTLSRGSDCHDKYRYNCDGITEYMEGICSGDVIFENTFNVAVCEQD